MEHGFLPPSTMLMLFHAVTGEFQVKVFLLFLYYGNKNLACLILKNGKTNM